MARVEIDSSELGVLGADLNRASVRVAGEIRPMLAKGAGNVKDQLRTEMAESTHFRGVASAITYDLVADGAGLEARIGPESSGPGALANIAYFGGSRGGGTVPDPRGALEAELPAFERAVNDLMGNLL